MDEIRLGRQTPTTAVVLPYTESLGTEAVTIYNKSGRTAQDWQALMMEDIMAVNADGLWTHMKFGWSIPRRNGKSELLIMRAIWGLLHGERILYTAHRTTTSSNLSRFSKKILEFRSRIIPQISLTSCRWSCIHDGTERNMDTLYHHRRSVGMPYHVLCIRYRDAQRGKNSTEII